MPLSRYSHGIILLLFSLAIISNISFGQTLTPRSVSGLGSVRGYYEYLPQDYENNNELYPLLLFLHGAGERGTGSVSDLEKVKRHGPPKHINNGHDMCFTTSNGTECFLVLSPQQDRAQWGWNKDVIPFIDYALANYRIDPNRVYVTGLSMGGDGTWDGMRSDFNSPNRIAAACPIAGKGQYAEGCTAGERRIPIWGFHGDADTATPLRSHQQAISGATDCGTGPDPLFTIYPGVGHGGAWQRAYRTDNSLHTPNLYQWLLSQRKGDPIPSPPSVNAGADITITLPTNSTTLTGTATDNDGSISSVIWTQVNGPNSATLSSASSLSTPLSNLIEGTYSFQLEATDDTGLKSTDVVLVIVQPEPPNIPPTANAGADKSITLPASNSSFNGSGTDSDGTITSYLWAQISGPNTATTSDLSASNISLSDLIEGIYTFSLSVTDNEGATGSDQVQVTVNPEPPNSPPTAFAGNNYSITLPTNSTIFNGTGSDSDGTIVGYNWTIVNGPSTPTTSDLALPELSLSNLIEGVYTYQLTVTDDDGDTGSDNIVLNVEPEPFNDPPTANAGADIIITLPVNNTSLTGGGNDIDGTIASYQWTQESGPNIATTSALNVANVDLSDLIEGLYVFRLTVTDDDGDTGSDQVNITVNPIPPNDPPAANAGNDQTITLPTNSVNLNGTGTDADGTIVDYNWSFLSGPSNPTFSNSATASSSLSNLIEGTYVIRLTVTDDDGATNSDQVNIIVNPEPPNAPPSVNAGTDQTVTLPINTANLTGSASDSDGTISGYNWNQNSGPSAATITSPTTASTTISDLVEGIYVFVLSATDDDGESATDQVRVTVFAESNEPPVANAGADQTITLPANNVSLTGNATDSDGTIENFLWTQISGPFSVAIPNPTLVNITLSNLIQGIYVFNLQVTDDDGDTGSDQVTVTVNPEPFNNPPIANAGPDINLTLPDNSATINGSATDSDGTVVSYTWSFESGPDEGGATILDEPTLEVVNLIEGIYVFSLTVADDDGEIDTDEMRVIVGTPNSPPTSNAGADIVITLPTNSTNLTGSGIDSDGTVDFYLWNQVSGPSTAIIANNLQANTEVSNLTEGIYTFSLFVEDNEGGNDTDNVRVTVNPEPPNIPPTANAGTSQQITEPVSTITLNGSGTDSDGTIASYSWSQLTGPNTAASSITTNPSVTYSGLIPGNYSFRLTVTDNDGASGTSDVALTVHPKPGNEPPVVNAGSNITITLPENSVTLTATANDSDGSIISTQWSQFQGPVSATITSSNQLSTSVNDLVEGLFRFEITVTDNDGGISTDQVDVLVNPLPENEPPIADGGPNQIIIEPSNSTTLNGSGSDGDGSIISFEWTLVEGPSNPTLLNANQPTLSVNNLSFGVYVFRLTVTDNDGSIGFDEVNVTVQGAPVNQPPVVNSGDNQLLVLPTNEITIIGTANDSDGTINSLLWTQESGPNIATLTDPSIETLSLSNLIEGVYILRLSATDNDGATGFDEINIRVNPPPPNQPPTVDAGTNQSLTLPTNSLSITGSVTDEDVTTTALLWTVESGPNNPSLAGQTSSTLELSNMINGIYVVRLTATDLQGEASFDEMQVTVNPAPADNPPLVDAGPDQSITLPTNQMSITGTASDDGTISSVMWEQTSGPINATLTNTSSQTVQLNNLIAGSYTMRFSATDNQGFSSFDEMIVSVLPAPNNQAPVANAGEDIQLLLPNNNTTLNGTATDTDGTIVSFNWNQISGPSNAALDNPSIPNPTVSQLIDGTYIFQLRAFDESGDFGQDEVSVFVLGNLPPLAFAGPDTVVTDVVSSIAIDGGGSDADGTVVSYNWTQDSGPNNISFNDPTQENVVISNLIVGVYTITLTVEDDRGGTASDNLTVTVLSSIGENNEPIVNAGDDIIIELPVNSASLEGTAQDVDGAIVSYLWEQVAGPADATFTSTDLPNTIVGNLMLGTYSFRLSATDNLGAIAFDEVNVRVKETELSSLEASSFISPNGDGINEFFVIEKIDQLAGCGVSIFTISGDKVFEAKPYMNDWNGTTSNGVQQPTGAYFYLIKCDSGSSHSGGLRIIRN